VVATAAAVVAAVVTELPWGILAAGARARRACRGLFLLGIVGEFRNRVFHCLPLHLLTGRTVGREARLIIRLYERAVVLNGALVGKMVSR
jgi:hypothetical protein